HILSDSASQGSDRPQQIRDLWCRIGDMPNTVADPLEEIRQALLERGPLERFEELLERVTDHVADYRLELLEHVGAVPDEFTDSTERTLEAVSQVGGTLEQIVQDALTLNRLQLLVEPLHAVSHLSEPGEACTLRGRAQNVHQLTRLAGDDTELLQLLNTGVDHPVQLAGTFRLFQPITETGSNIVGPAGQTRQILGASLPENRHRLHQVIGTQCRYVDRLVQVAEHFVERGHIEVRRKRISHSRSPLAQSSRSFLNTPREMRERLIPGVH